MTVALPAQLLCPALQKMSQHCFIKAAVGQVEIFLNSAQLFVTSFTRHMMLMPHMLSFFNGGGRIGVHIRR
jgi:hypothetical protein